MSQKSSAPEGAASLRADAAARKRAERDRKRAIGLIKVEVWVRPEHAERVRKLAARMT